MRISITLETCLPSITLWLCECRDAETWSHRLPCFGKISQRHTNGGSVFIKAELSDSRAKYTSLLDCFLSIKNANVKLHIKKKLIRKVNYAWVNSTWKESQLYKFFTECIISRFFWHPCRSLVEIFWINWIELFLKCRKPYYYINNVNYDYYNHLITVVNIRITIIVQNFNYFCVGRLSNNSYS